jgi:MoxR-like ATPase
MEQSDARGIAERIIENIQRVIVGKGREVETAVIALLGQGHILIEDVPGVYGRIGVQSADP